MRSTPFMSSVRVLLTPVSLLLCVLALAVPAWAEEDPGKAAERLAQLRRNLKSDKAATVAHAAYAASEEGLRDLTPDLIRTLAARPKPEGWEAWLVIKHLLDALIRLEAKVPMTTLGRFEDDTRTSILILAVRNGADAYPLLRKTLERSVRGKRIRASGVAAGNILAAVKDKSVAPFALGHIQTTLSLTVVDHDRLTIGGGAGGSFGHGDGWCNVPAGFPPIVWYELEFAPDKRHWSRLLVRGPVKDVWYERWVNTRKRFIIGDLSDKGDANDIARGWVADLLGLAVDELPLKERYYRHHQWKDADTYLAFAKAKQSEVERAAAELLDRLVKAGYLTAKQRATIKIEPRTKVRDGRDDKRVPLPKIESRSG